MGFLLLLLSVCVFALRSMDAWTGDSVVGRAELISVPSELACCSFSHSAGFSSYETMA